MDNTLPGNPSNPNNDNPNQPPPPFGSNFNPHTNPIDPNNPYTSQPPQQPIPQPTPTSLNPPEPPDSSKHEHYSEAAQQKPRDENGRFVKDHGANISPPSETAAIPHPSSFMPPIVEINQNTKPTEKEDPPLFGFFITNPVTYLKKFLTRLLKRQMITLRIPVLALLIIMVGLGGFGVGFKSGSNYILGKLFPNFSPILGRAITAQGIILKSSKGYYLQANDKDKTMWTLNPATANINLTDFENQKVEIKGKMTPTPYLIEVSEVTSFDIKPTPVSATSPSQNTPTSPNPPNPPDSASLPALFPGLTWEVTKTKTLIFTSGLRKIEQEGVYLESAQVPNFPQDFINYYTNQLSNLGFKQTLNSSEPAGITITYAKDELFLTFGIKNIYSGSGDNKQSLRPDGLKKLVGYKAFIEHN